MNLHLMDADMKKKVIKLGVFIFAAAIVGVIFFMWAGRRPFDSLRVSDVKSAAVHLTPPDKSVEIIDIPELVTLLSEVVIYNRDDSFSEYSGQSVAFTLELADGTCMNIAECGNTFVIVDGVGYKAKYEPCEKLSRYVNGLL